jgi:hypothetical protein
MTRAKQVNADKKQLTVTFVVNMFGAFVAAIFGEVNEGSIRVGKAEASRTFALFSVVLAATLTVASLSFAVWFMQRGTEYSGYYYAGTALFAALAVRFLYMLVQAWKAL